jgi:hypothetical protein
MLRRLLQHSPPSTRAGRAVDATIDIAVAVVLSVLTLLLVYWLAAFVASVA